MTIFNKIINLFKSGLFPPKGPQSKQSVAAVSEGAFLEDFFRLHRDGYKTVCIFHSKEAFKMEIKDSSDATAFTFEISTRKEPGKLGLLYIEYFQRRESRHSGIGKEIATAIRKYAETEGFYKILLNPVAVSEPGKDYLSQEQLEEFYRKYLNGDNVQVEFAPNNNSFYSEDLPQLRSLH